MITLLADAAQTATNTLDATSIGQLLGSTLAASGITGWISYRAGKRASTPVDINNSPLIVDRAAKYATIEDLRKLETDLSADIHDLKARQTNEMRDVHQRLNGITIKLNEVSGKQDLMIDLIKSPHHNLQV